MYGLDTLMYGLDTLMYGLDTLMYGLDTYSNWNQKTDRTLLHTHTHTHTHTRQITLHNMSMSCFKTT